MSCATLKKEENKKQGLTKTVRRLLHRLTKGLLFRAKQEEPRVTSDMKQLECMGAELIGLSHRMKSYKSLFGKIFREFQSNEQTMRETAVGITDVLRYTVTADSSIYSKVVPEAIDFLANYGYNVSEFRNAWGDRFYQGVNVHFYSPGGVRVEVQFHTPQSFAVKEASHEVYEIRRSGKASPEEVAKAIEKSIEYNARVCIPKGAAEIKWPSAA